MHGESSQARTVYMVTSGEYSDYDVVAIFEHEADAERYVEARMGERVEEMTLHAEFPTIHTVYRATIYKHGGGGRTATPGELRETHWRSDKRPEHRFSETNWAFEAEGPDRERAVKSVSDRYAKWKAEQAGVA